MKEEQENSRNENRLGIMTNEVTETAAYFDSEEGEIVVVFLQKPAIIQPPTLDTPFYS